jgi:hypothetical protein
MRTLLLVLVLAVVGVPAAFGQGKGKGKGKSKQATGVAAVNARFSAGDASVITDYYRPRLGQLPPGLEKKLARGGTLPPGWQKKVGVFPPELVGRLGPAPVGYSRVVSGRVAMLVHDATNVVMDIIDLTR